MKYGEASHSSAALALENRMGSNRMGFTFSPSYCCLSYTGLDATCCVEAPASPHLTDLSSSSAVIFGEVG